MPGNSRITAAGVLGLSGAPLRVFGYTMRSADTGPGVMTLYNGTATTGTEKWRGQGNQGFSSDKLFTSHGKFFPGGCYVDMDSDVLYIDLEYEQENR